MREKERERVGVEKKRMGQIDEQKDSERKEHR